MEKLKWEQVTENDDTWRLRVHNGWLVRYDSDISHDDPVQGRISGLDWRSCMVFVPDRYKLWGI